jgi:hypothetical protein
LLSLWGGTKRRIHNVLLGGLGACLLGILTLGLGRVVLVWALGSFFFSFFEPFVEGGNIAIWQAKVEADVQGRVFSARHWLVQIPYLMGVFVAGPLAEYGVMPLLGMSPVTGMSFLVVWAGILGGMVFLLGYMFAPVRKAEMLLPDPSPEVAGEVSP